MSGAVDFDALVDGLVALPREPFEPFAWFNELGDSLEIYLAPRPHVAERVNSLLTVFVDEDDPERVVGLVIKQVRKHLGGPFGAVLDVGRASVRGIVCSAIASYEVDLTRKPKAKIPEPPEDRPRFGSDRLRPLLDDLGDVEVLVQNRDRLQLA